MKILEILLRSEKMVLDCSNNNSENGHLGQMMKKKKCPFYTTQKSFTSLFNELKIKTQGRL